MSFHGWYGDFKKRLVKSMCSTEEVFTAIRFVGIRLTLIYHHRLHYKDTLT